MKHFLLKLFLSLFIIIPLCTEAQHKPQYTQYMQNNFLVNPAIAGIESYTDIKNGYRTQWQGVDGAPRTFYITAHTPFYTNKRSSRSKYSYKQDKLAHSREQMSSKKRDLSRAKSHHGVGAKIAVDQTGGFSRYNGELTYAYHQKLGREIFMSAGFSFGYTASNFNTAGVDMGESADLAILNVDEINTYNFDIHSGILIYGRDFHFGIAVNQALNAEPHYLEVEDDNKASNNMNLFSTLAVKFNTSRELDIIPSAIVKKIGDSPLSFDFSVKSVLRNRYWAGVAYRNSNTISAFVGLVVLPFLDVSYSYDYGINQLDLASRGSSEVIVGFRFPRGGKKKRKIKRGAIPCPSYF